MKNTIAKICDTSMQAYELDWIDGILKDFISRERYRNPSASFYVSMVSGFANRLPYSMDIEQPEYVPSDFMHMLPIDFEKNSWFQDYGDEGEIIYTTMYDRFLSWGDTFKTGILLHLCFIFQKMILGEIPGNLKIEEEKYTELGIDRMTGKPEYNRRFFEALQSLPVYYRRLISASSNEARRTVLKQIYDEMIDKLAARFGSFRETNAEGNVVRESASCLPIKPSGDIDMLMHFNSHITFHDGIKDVTAAIKEEQLKRYVRIRPKTLNETPESKLLALSGTIEGESTPKI